MSSLRPVPSPETTTGGNALKFYSSVRLDIRRIGAIKNADEVVGNRTRVKVAKNKLAAPFRQAEFDICYGHGISRAGEVLDLAVDADLVDKNGAWYSHAGERMGQGRDKARDYLLAHQDLLRDLRAKLLDKAGIAKGADGQPKDENVGRGPDGQPEPKDEKADGSNGAAQIPGAPSSPPSPRASVAERRARRAQRAVVA